MRRRAILLGCPVVLFAAPCRAQDDVPARISFNGSLGSQAALLILDGEPRTILLGQTVRGIKLLSLADDRAVVEIGGQRHTLLMGATPGRVGGGANGSATGRQIVLSSGPGGHFTALGSINGHATQFLVDTGATAVSIGQAEAERLGLRYAKGKRVTTQTANGPATASVLTLDTVRIGDVEVHSVEAIVVPSQMSHVLLGNSFLSRFQMRRDNDILTLDLRY
jgi:aspartyl protease family protein